MDTTPHAVIVYGTLRRGAANHRLIAPYGPKIQTVTVPGWQLMGAGYWFPYAVPHPERSLIGDLCTFTKETWLDALASMDKLEGYPWHYTRLRVPAVTGDGRAVVGWMFTPTNGREAVDRLSEVPGGDWIEHRQAVAS